MHYKCPEWLTRPGWVIFSPQCYWNRPFRTICDPASVTRKSTDLAPKHLRSLLTIVQDRVDNRPKPARPSRVFYTLRVLLRFFFVVVASINWNNFSSSVEHNWQLDLNHWETAQRANTPALRTLEKFTGIYPDSLPKAGVVDHYSKSDPSKSSILGVSCSFLF